MYKKADDAVMTGECNKIAPIIGGSSTKGLDLLERSEEFQTKEAHFPRGVLAQDLGHDGGRLAGDKAGGSRRGGGNGEMNRLIWPEDVR